jgi:hypothetical protein
MRFLLFLWILGLAACTHHPVRIDCEKHLEAINPPNPVLKGAAVESP